MNKAEPRFDIDLAYGQQGEALVGTFLDWIAHHQVEVKRKRMFDWKFYVEAFCDKGRTGYYQPSGILVTTAKAWAIVIADTKLTLLVPTEDLFAMIDDPTTKDAEAEIGGCPTRGYLVDFTVFLWRCKKRQEQQLQGAAS